jgi:hypothetical protein
MATYYVKPAAQGGNNLLAGTSPSTAWATVAYALTSSSGFASGDTLYIAPGVYTNQISVTIANPTVETNIIGDPSCSQFSGLTAGPVVITNYNATLSGSGYTGTIISATTKNYLHFQNIKFASENSRTMLLTTCTNLKLTKCSFIARQQGLPIVAINSPTSTAVNLTVSKCVFFGGANSLSVTGQNVADGSTITDCIFISAVNAAVNLTSVQVAIYNCSIYRAQYGVALSTGSLTFPTTVRNCLIFTTDFDLLSISPANTIIENYNRLLGVTARGNVADNLTSSIVGDIGVDLFETLLWNINNVQPFTSYLSSPNASFGNATGAPATDIYGVTWTGTSPDAGAGTYRVITSVPVNIGYVANLPVNTQATTITIAPASTSQSVDLYLGATGLTFATSGLAAYYVRNQSAPVAITLVTQTPTGAWTSGGFAEIDSSLVPGVYRLDVPNAAFSAGASDVTIVVRGASGTNGAVLTVTLSSGGLTAAQTASAVWGESPAGYATATTFGGVLNETNQLTNSIDQEVGDVAGNVWDELRTNHVTAGTFGQYVNAELVTPVTSAALVRMGPFEVRADGLGASDPLDIQKGAQHGIDIQCVDNNGAGIDITSATVTAKVYNSGATLVDTYSCTATYAADGRATFTIDTTVTNVPGTYTATITRSTSANDTQVFGPLRVYVRDI